MKHMRTDIELPPVYSTGGSSYFTGIFFYHIL